MPLLYEETSRIIAVGSCNMDLISYIPRFPEAGETVHGTKFSIGFGGKGANQSVCAARLGGSTALIAKVGDDSFGNDYLDNLKNNNINLEHVEVVPNMSTGVAPIAVRPDGMNNIIIVNGANDELMPNDIQKAESTIAASKVLVCQLEVAEATTLEALKLAKKYGVTTVMNPAPARTTLDPEIYSLSDYFCPNEPETEMLTGVPVKTVLDADEAVKILLARGCQNVILTLGDKGAVSASQEHPKPVHVPARQVEAVDTTGAGDAFIGSLAYFLAYFDHHPIEEIIQRSCDIATISVQAQGTQKSYPYKADLPPELFN